MYCGKCGAENNNGTAFCTKCGAVLDEGHTNLNSDDKEIKFSSKNRKVGIIVSVVVVVIALIAVFNIFGGRGYESTVKKYFNATMKADASAIIKLIPEEVLEKELKDEGYDKEEMNLFMEEGEKELKKAMDKIDDSLGEGWKMTYDITESEDIIGKDLKEVKEDYENFDIKISEAKKVKVKVKIKAKNNNENSNTTKLYLIKVGRNWYLDVKNMGIPF